MKDLSRMEAEPLLTALQDSSASVRLAALRAIVRLTLSREAWLEVSRHVLALLETPPEGDTFTRQTLVGIPYQEVIDAAVFVPTKTVRGRLHDLLQAADPELRSATAHALATARDSAAVSQLLVEVFADAESLRIAAAKSLSLLSEPSMLKAVRLAYSREADHDVRFWLALTLAGLDETAEIEQVLRDLRSETLVLKELWGDPSRFTDQLRQRGPFPENVRQLFQRIAREKEDQDEDFTSRAAMCLFRAGQPQPIAAAPELRPEPSPDSELEALTSTIVHQLELRQELAIESLRPEVLAYLPTTLAPQFATLLFRDAVQNRQMGWPANEIVQGIFALGDGFVPDLPGLIECYFEIGRNEASDTPRDLYWQIAWVVSRAELSVVLLAFGPPLIAADERERKLTARLIEQAALYADQDYPPIFGGGGAPNDLAPSTSVLFDESSEKGGSPPDSYDRRREGLGGRNFEIGYDGRRYLESYQDENRYREDLSEDADKESSYNDLKGRKLIDNYLKEQSADIEEEAPPEQPQKEERPEIGPEIRPEVRAEGRPEVRPEIRPEVRAEGRPEIKPEVRRESRPELRPEIRPEIRPEVRAEGRPEIKPEVRRESRPELRPEIRPEVRAEGPPEIRPEIRPEVRAEGRPERKPEAKELPREETDSSGQKAEPGKRVINTGFAPRTDPDNKIKNTMPLKAGEEYYFWLDRDWLQKETSGEETPVDISPVPDGARLTIAIFGFQNGIEIVRGEDIGEVEIRGGGPFKVISQPMKESAPRAVDLDECLYFPVRSPKRSGTFQMRCNIYWRQLLLQSRLINARVMINPKPAKGSKKAWRSVLDYTLSRQLNPSHLNQLTEHRLSILLNKNSDGTHSFHLFGSDGNERFKQDDVRFDPGELQDLIKLARGSLRLASWGTVDEWAKNDYKYQDRQKKKDRLQADLINLAKWGYEFYFSIRKKLAGGREAVAEFEKLMLEPGIVQIAMKESPSYVLPAAMLYDYPIDTAAAGNFSLCPAFEKALDQNELFENLDCFRGKCPSRGNRKVICPSGFWGFRHSLGMPLSEENKSDVYPQILVEHELKMAVSVATNLNFLAAHVNAVEASARKLKSGLLWTYADTRDKVFDILKKSPHLVYFYCHGGLSRESLPFLQVGTEDLIFPSTLGTMEIVWNKPRPLVFINGCHTTAVDPLKALQFIGPLMTDSRSAGVIGTEITIFEELATAFAEECLARFCAKEPIGSAIRNARLKLLAEGNPLGLVYIPFVMAGLRLEY